MNITKQIFERMRPDGIIDNSDGSRMIRYSVFHYQGHLSADFACSPGAIEESRRDCASDFRRLLVGRVYDKLVRLFAEMNAWNGTGSMSMDWIDRQREILRELE